MTEQKLLEGLRAVKRERQEFPPETAIEKEIFYCRECIWELKLECERRRAELRIQYATSRKRIVTRIVDDLQIEETKTLFNWEPLHEYSLSFIDSKECKGIEYYTAKINQIRQ